MATMKRRVIYLSDAEWERLKRRAAELDMTISAYVRSKALFANTESGVAYEVRPLVPSVVTERHTTTDAQLEAVRFNTQPFRGPIPKARK